VPNSATTTGAPEAGPEAGLARLERRVAAQAAALAQVPLNMPIPGHVLALLATVPRELDGVQLPARCRPRLVKLHGDLQILIDEVTLRERELAGRIATVRAARRRGPAPHLLDYAG
jgi:hypothetical protein